jgi:DNA-binding GntR family transcriptional regulator
MTDPTHILICRLLERAGALSMRQIAAEMNMSYGGIRHAVKQMDRLGIIDREPNAGVRPPRGGDAPHLWRTKS